MRKKTVFFDDVRPVILPVIMYCLFRGYEIHIFDFEYNLKSSAWLAKLINIGRVKRIFIKPNSKEHGEAIDYTETIFKCMRNKILPQITTYLYQDCEVDLIFKKEMVKEIFKCIYINRYFSAKRDYKLSPNENILIQYKSWKYEIYLNKYCPGSLSHLRNATIPKWLYPLRCFAYYLSWSKYYFASILFIIFFIFLAIYAKLTVRVNKKKQRYDFVISIEQPSQIKFKGERGFDFILNNDTIRKENTLFLISDFVDKEWVRDQLAMGFNISLISNYYSLKNLYLFNYDLASPIKTFFLLIKAIFQFKSPAAFYSAFMKSIIVIINCSIIFNRLTFKSYIYTNNESTSQIAKNIFLKKRNVKSWYYLIFLVGGYPRSKSRKDFKYHRNIIWSFLNPDYLIGMNDDVIYYFRMHKQNIKKYFILGSFFSETVRYSMANINRYDFIKKHFPKDTGNGRKICSFFDTTFVDEQDAFANFEDCIAFYTDIINLLSSRRDLLIIIKPSKDESFFYFPRGQWSSPKKGEKIAKLLNTIKQFPRVYFAGDAGDIPAIMAVSDLVVTHCMSSTTAEALGARKKAIWYESGAKHRGLLYDNIPGLVSHGYRELEDKIKFLLDTVSDKEYEDYLDLHIKGKIESHLDGLALTRFRNLLSSDISGF